MNDRIFDNRGFSAWRTAKGVTLGFLVMIAFMPIVAAAGETGGFAVAAVLAAGALWWRFRRHADLLATMPTTAIDRLDFGYVEVSGTAASADGRELRDPIQNKPCLWFGIETVRLEKDGMTLWLPVKRVASSRPFQLRDDSGKCLVDVSGAQLALRPPVDVPVNDHVKHRIWRILDGEQITVVGDAQRWSEDWCVCRPAGQKFFVTSGAADSAEQSLGDEARGHRSKVVTAVIVAIVVLVVIALISGCAKRDDEADVKRSQAEKERAEFSAQIDAQLAETARPQRWREEQRRWSELKAARTRERKDVLVQDVARARDIHPDLIRELDALRRRGALGAAGDLPPQLELTISAWVVKIRNTSPEPLTVRAWRMFGSGPAAQACELTAQRNHRPQSNARLAAGEALSYENATWAPCNRGDEKSPMAFEIRRADKIEWVSGSRLPEILGVPPDALASLLESRP